MKNIFIASALRTQISFQVPQQSQQINLLRAARYLITNGAKLSCSILPNH